jgi:hypothetical protein
MGWKPGYDSKRRLYCVWSGMKRRCFDPRHKDFPRYGKRGIGIDEGWLSFPQFKAWASTHGYNEGLVIDRVDNNRGYGPDNCRFVSRAESNRNTSTTKLSHTIVAEIRRKYQSGQYRQKDLIAEFPMSSGHMSMVVNGMMWVKA